MADVDGDGHRDLYVTAVGPNRFYRNNGDGWHDLFMANDSTPNFLYQNKKNGTLPW